MYRQCTVFSSVQKLIQGPYNFWKLYVSKCIDIMQIYLARRKRLR